MNVEIASSRVALVACHTLIIPTFASSGYPSLSFCIRPFADFTHSYNIRSCEA